MGLQLLTPFFRNFIEPGVDPFQVLKIRQQLCGAFRPNTGTFELLIPASPQ